jgi:hypothetical protein
VSRRTRGALAIARVLVALVVAATAWPLVAPAYDRAVTAAAMAILRRRPSTADLHARVEGEWTIVEPSTPASDVATQRLELRTHHNNVPFLAVLILLASTLPGPVRARRLAIGLLLLAATHVGQFVLYVHADRALLNERPYRVTDVRALKEGWSERMRDPVERRKRIVLAAFEFQAHVGHVLIPVLLWLALAAPLRRSPREGLAPGIAGG